jgi:ABC-type multidrug transport system ATPase subunit
MKIAIKVENLVKRYDKMVAVDLISFAIQEGELFGLLVEEKGIRLLIEAHARS